MSVRTSGLGLCLASALALGGCLLRDVDKAPVAPLGAMPDAFASGEGAADADPGRWWTTFGDEGLDQLVDAALAGNFQIKQAWARLDQLEAMTRIAGAGMMPRVGGELSAGRSLSPPRIFNLGGGEQTIPGVEASNFGASLPVSYELDVWGRVRAGKLAAEEDAAAARGDVESAAMTVAANVAERWFDVVEQRATQRLLNDQLATNESFLQLVQIRFEDGQAALSDVLQQTQGLQSLRARLAQSRAVEAVADRQLAVLTGRAPSAIVRGDRTTLPEPPALPAAGVPATLLQRRPDLRAAQRRVVAADYRIAQAIAARFPTFSLNGSLGFNAPQLSSFFESFIWGLTGSIAGAIWDGGLGTAQIDQAEAQHRELLYGYGQTLLTALLEVESSLAREQHQQENITILRQQVETARRTLEAARLRFQAGVSTFLPVLTALQSLQTSEQGLLAAQRQLLSLRVQLYRALGSQWTRELKPPPPPEEEDT